MAATPTTQDIIYSVRVLKGVATRQQENIVNRCQEIIEGPINDPYNRNVIKKYRKAYEAAIKKYQASRLNSEELTANTAKMEKNKGIIEKDVQSGMRLRQPWWRW